MFSVKISYHHQRRLAVHYRVEALLNDSWVASPAENPLLSAWSSLVWRWTLSTQGFFEPNLCCSSCNSSFGRASARSSFISSAGEEYSKIQLFFPWDPVGNILNQLWVFLWALRLCPCHSEFPKSALSPDSGRFSPAQPIWAQILSTHRSWLYPLIPPGYFSDATIQPQNCHFSF